MRFYLSSWWTIQDSTLLLVIWNLLGVHFRRTITYLKPKLTQHNEYTLLHFTDKNITDNCGWLLTIRHNSSEWRQMAATCNWFELVTKCNEDRRKPTASGVRGVGSETAPSSVYSKRNKLCVFTAPILLSTPWSWSKSQYTCTSIVHTL